MGKLSSKEQFRKTLLTLQQKYLKSRPQYKSKQYNETDVRLEFLDVLFSQLGWDLKNESALPPIDREVILERGDCKGKRPDYNFRLNGETKFYLEAKAPHVTLNSPDPIHQAKSYSWSTTASVVPIAILSNFEEIFVFDTTLVPDYEYPDRGKVFHFKVEEYSNPNVIDQLWSLSKEEMMKGTLEKRVSMDSRWSSFKERPDDRLLVLLNDFRLQLSKSIFSENPRMSLDEIQDVVTTILHRLLFIRVLEDRGTVDRAELKDLVEEWQEARGAKGPLLIASLAKQFDYINSNFNGKLFVGNPFEGVKVNGSELAGVIKKLYGRSCPFAFNRLDPNTLGHIYEKFLSEELAKSGRGLKLEKRESIRKAGGVFYTPKEIVRLICSETFGDQLKNANNLLDIQVLDPACGSGTFLITAYQMLMEEQLRRSGKLERLSFATKKDLLLQCIYGIDIDSEAVKIAILSLCLSALEDEPHISQGKRLLPNLKGNILIADSLLHENKFNRQFVDHAQFPPKQSNLTIVGNPPYLNVKRGFFEAKYKDYLETNYTNSAVKQWDTYAVFFERGLQWEPKNFGLIVPKPILTNSNQASVRKLLVENNLSQVIDVGAVFEDASVETVVMICNENTSNSIVTAKLETDGLQKVGAVKRDKVSEGQIINLQSNPKLEKVFEMLDRSKLRLNDILQRPVLRGIEKGKNALESKKSKTGIPCFAGEEVQERLVGKPKNFISVDWKIKKDFKEQSLYSGPKILVRRVTNDLKACVDYSDSVCLNTLYVVKPGAGVDTELLAALLNSKIIRFWFRYKFVNDDVLFPYIRTEQIANIPIPEKFKELDGKSFGLAQEILHSDFSSEDGDVEKLDAILARAFGLSISDLKIIDEALSTLLRRAA
ncbi:MAG: hypothetical protein JWQ35_697 [Bacteriovoracaceae bacterium]|nr:hypothetical protein [Bacteriovoracaceae bacterium]